MGQLFLFEKKLIERVPGGQKLVNVHNGRAKKLNLTATLTEYEWKNTMKYFDGRCALNPKSKDVEMAHFIPLEWKIGGTYMGNMIPLDKRLNQMWSRNNPMLWLAHGGNLREHGISLEHRDRLINFVLSYCFPGHEKPFDSLPELFDFTFPAYRERRMDLVNNYYEERSRQFDVEQESFHRWYAMDWKTHFYYRGH